MEDRAPPPETPERRRSQMWTATGVQRQLEGHIAAERDGFDLRLTWDDQGIRARRVGVNGEDCGPDARIEEGRWWLPSRSGQVLALSGRLAQVLSRPAETEAGEMPPTMS